MKPGRIVTKINIHYSQHLLHIASKLSSLDTTSQSFATQSDRRVVSPAIFTFRQRVFVPEGRVERGQV